MFASFGTALPALWVQEGQASADARIYVEPFKSGWTDREGLVALRELHPTTSKRPSTGGT